MNGKLRPLLVAAVLALPWAAPSFGEVRGSIGISEPAYPQLEPVPGYPVYYAPGVDTNYFFYEGRYWVFVNDAWYSSAWYNGPWTLVAPEAVPVYVLRVPVRYYRRPPPYFRGWASSAPPRWGEHYGPGWEQQHRGWDHWDRARAPRPAPPPVYQRQYSGERYPHSEEQQRMLHEAHGHPPPGARPPGPPQGHEDHGRGHEGRGDHDRGAGHERKNDREN